MTYVKLDILNLSKYETNEFGIIRNIKSKKVLKINLKGGLQITTLKNDNNKSRGFFIHLLVAKIFVPNPNNYRYIMHIDDNKFNNHKLNLQWTNTRQNRNNNPIEKQYKIWKQVVGLENYEVSPNGYIRNKFSKKVLNGSLHCGYIRVNIKDKKYFLHVLLAKTFLGEPNNDETVDHIDRNKLNNDINNLRWASKKIQVINREHKNKKLKRPIGQYTLHRELIKEWDSIKQAAQFFNTWTASFKHNKIIFGFLWKYHDVEHLSNEIFKNISDVYINIYPELTKIQVSNMGRIKFNKGRITYGSTTDCGYKIVNLKKNYYIHRLVMYAFDPNEENMSLIVNHKDGDKSNNKLDNLEWCSLKENVYHTVNILNKIGKTVYQYSIENVYINEYNSIRDASIKTNIHKSTITACLIGHNKSGGGYKWYYQKLEL